MWMGSIFGSRGSLRSRQLRFMIVPSFFMSLATAVQIDNLPDSNVNTNRTVAIRLMMSVWIAEREFGVERRHCGVAI